MKNSVYIIILLAVALLIVSYKLVSKSNEAPAPDSDLNNAIENIMTRSSIRAYTSQNISDGLMDTLLRAAMAAPTAGNKQPWRFVVIRDTTTLRYIAANFGPMKMMNTANAAVVVCGDMNDTFPGNGRDYWVQDASAATENLLLAAHASGLGAVWCGVYPMPERVAAFSELLKLPADIIPLNCVALGYPQEPGQPKDKWKPQNIHYETW
ncbi:MAG: nitroreductase family protein [Muribaculaceae bacterium]|nr:nitroreductase family protein [Muribaculaceae bacterium]